LVQIKKKTCGAVTVKEKWKRFRWHLMMRSESCSRFRWTSAGQTSESRNVPTFHAVVRNLRNKFERLRECGSKKPWLTLTEWYQVFWFLEAMEHVLHVL